LGAAKLIPSSLIGDTPLIQPQELRRVRDFYGGDWDACRAFAKASNRKALRED
jgi:hypothetical protein